jgi:hypothetical protein
MVRKRRNSQAFFYFGFSAEAKKRQNSLHDIVGGLSHPRRSIQCLPPRYLARYLLLRYNGRITIVV